MARIKINQSALSKIQSVPAVKQAMKKLGETIHEDARDNTVRMGAYESGALRGSGFVDQDEGVTRIGFVVPYAAIIHEGAGRGRNAGPRPFLMQAASKRRGKL